MRARASCLHPERHQPARVAAQLGFRPFEPLLQRLRGRLRGAAAAGGGVGGGHLPLKLVQLLLLIVKPLLLLTVAAGLDLSSELLWRAVQDRGWRAISQRPLEGSARDDALVPCQLRVGRAQVGRRRAELAFLGGQLLLERSALTLGLGLPRLKGALPSTRKELLDPQEGFVPKHQGT